MVLLLEQVSRVEHGRVVTDNLIMVQVRGAW